MISPVAEEFPRGCVDPVSAPAEINTVQVKLEGSVLADFSFQRERKDRFLDFPAEAAVVGQKDIACKLLCDCRSRADAMVFDGGRGDRTPKPDWINSDMAAEAT